MDVDFVKWLSTLGVGGAIAGFMFLFYRKDVKTYTEQWKMVGEQLMSVVKENTASNVKLITMIENQERNAMRKDDIEALIDQRLKNK